MAVKQAVEVTATKEVRTEKSKQNGSGGNLKCPSCDDYY